MYPVAKVLNLELPHLVKEIQTQPLSDTAEQINNRGIHSPLAWDYGRLLRQIVKMDYCKQSAYWTQNLSAPTSMQIGTGSITPFWVKQKADL
jgi:hypothetical protein